MRTLAWILGALPVLALALVGLRYLIRGTPVTRVRTAALHEAKPFVDDPEFRCIVELLAHVHLSAGNQVELLCSGDETYPRLFADLRSSQRAITLQLYYCKPGKLADQLHDILTERARAGVRVLFLWDAFGAQALNGEYRESLEAAGVNVALFRPLHWYDLEKAYNRSHIRVAVVDAQVGYTGGFGIDDKWLGDGRHDGQWRDTNVRFTGHAVLGLQAAFAAGWAEATGDLLTGEPFFDGADEPEPPPGEGVLAGVMHAAPTVGSTSAERYLALTISGARRSLDITNAYFVPDDGFCGLLETASRHGANVRILTAGEKIDVGATRFAGRSRYERLLLAGIRIWEYQPTMIHAKTIVADGCFGSVGTMNFDNRSMVFNDESNLIFYDEGVGRALHEMFEADLAFSREITLEEFRQRPWTQRLQERFYGALTRIL